jgi:hypothetical protein
MLYEPATTERPSAKGQEAAYYWIHQDAMSPEPLKTRDGKTIRSFADAMVWLIERELESRWAQTEDTVTFVPRGAGYRLRLHLSYGGLWDQSEFPLSIGPSWEPVR